MKARCEKQVRNPMKVEREIGRMLGKNSRAAKLFDVKVTKTDKDAARIEWSKVEVTRDWTTLSAGCNLLRTNIADWSDEELSAIRRLVLSEQRPLQENVLGSPSI